MRWVDGITDSMDISLSKLQRQWRTGAPGTLQSIAESWMWLSDWTATTMACVAIYKKDLFLTVQDVWEESAKVVRFCWNPSFRCLTSLCDLTWWKSTRELSGDPFYNIILLIPFMGLYPHNWVTSQKTSPPNTITLGCGMSIKEFWRKTSIQIVTPANSLFGLLVLRAAKHSTPIV